MQQHLYVPRSELDGRIARVQQQLVQSKLEGALIQSGINLFYLTGTMQNGALYIPAFGAPIFMVRRSLERAQIESPLDNIVPMTSFKSFYDTLAQFSLSRPRQVGIEFSIPMDAYQRVTKYVVAEFSDVQSILARVRSVKSEWEIGLLREAGAKQAENFRTIPQHYRRGMSELELAAEIERSMLLAGHHGTSVIQAWGNRLLIGYVSAGENGYFPHPFDGPGGCQGITPAVPELGSHRLIQKNEPVLIDLCFGVAGYHVDMTRIFCDGTLPQEALDAQKKCEEIQQMIVERLRPGQIPSEIYGDIATILTREGWMEHFMGYGDRAVKFLGHGVGLAVDEYPAIAKGFDEPIVAGMVFAVEPKKVIPGLGVVGVENTWLVGNERTEKLTDFVDGIQYLT